MSKLCAWCKGTGKVWGGSAMGIDKRPCGHCQGAGKA